MMTMVFCQFLCSSARTACAGVRLRFAAASVAAIVCRVKNSVTLSLQVAHITHIIDVRRVHQNRSQSLFLVDIYL